MCACALGLAALATTARADEPNDDPRLPRPGDVAAQPDGDDAEPAAPLTIDVALVGGTLMEWQEPGEAGNAYGVGLGFDYGDYRAALSVAGVAPDSRARSAFEVVWIDGWWTPFGRFFDLLAPYVVAGIGLATEDGLATRSDVPADLARWSPEGVQLVAMLGVGASYGPRREGLFLAADLRAYNVSHGGLVVTAGYRF